MWLCFDVSTKRGMSSSQSLSIDSEIINYHVVEVIKQITKCTATIIKNQMIERFRHTFHRSIDLCLCQISEQPPEYYGCWGWPLSWNCVRWFNLFVTQLMFKKIYLFFSDISKFLFSSATGNILPNTLYMQYEQKYKKMLKLSNKIQNKEIAVSQHFHQSKFQINV